MENPCFEWTLRWGARIEEPGALANRFCRTIDGLAEIYPRQTYWFWGDRKELLESEGETGRYPLATIRQNMPKAIERNAFVMKGTMNRFPATAF